MGHYHHGKVVEALGPGRGFQQAHELVADDGNGGYSSSLDLQRLAGTPRGAAASTGDSQDGPVYPATEVIERLWVVHIIPSAEPYNAGGGMLDVE